MPSFKPVVDFQPTTISKAFLLHIWKFKTPTLSKLYLIFNSILTKRVKN